MSRHYLLNPTKTMDHICGGDERVSIPAANQKCCSLSREEFEFGLERAWLAHRAELTDGHRRIPQWEGETVPPLAKFSFTKWMEPCYGNERSKGKHFVEDEGNASTITGQPSKQRNTRETIQVVERAVEKSVKKCTLEELLMMLSGNGVKVGSLSIDCGGKGKMFVSCKKTT